ncbi:SWIM zinc finger family protein [Streptosporangium roseum]|uniref:SWIM zinc finger family protein n=1 Tax=Streptosporangium roseum TaxID=2001 RepID=UPI001E4F2A2F|nr:SWIM zinc finger family protein [Streptosporangium roseum]
MTNAVQACSYAGPSRLSEGHLGLSTSGGRTAGGVLDHPRFFSGLLTQAAPAAAGLPAVADVALARYHRPQPGFTRDPVVTCGGVRLVQAESGPCTCPWWYDHRGSRGPCEHVLAARIALREVPGRQPSAAPRPSATQESSR